MGKMNEKARKEIYISIDIEADGPIPGPYSMLSLGACLAGSYDGREFTRPKEDKHFYNEFKPISNQYEPEALKICEQGGLDRYELLHSGPEPAMVMTAFENWVKGVAGGVRPIAVAYPLAFDWMFMYWYFQRFTGGMGPFGFSGHLDIKTQYATRARVPVYNAIKKQMPKKLLSKKRHTHNALDDAIEQAELFANIMEWEGK